jgi:hypothetical protein
MSLHSCLLAAFSAAVFAMEASAGFLPPTTYAVGSFPRSVAVGDFNGDGVPDLVVANQGTFENLTYSDDSSVSVLLGKGDGTFQAAQSFAAGSGPFSVAIGDFNGDGIVDLAVANYLYPHSTVSILLGKGDGTFGAAQSYAVGVVLGGGDYATSVAVADFNGDGRLDLAVASSERDALASAGFVSVLFGNGDGTFQDAQNYGVGFFPNSVAVGDFNGDGHPDIAVANGGATVSVLLANGDGTFQAAQSYQVGNGPQSLTVEDFNGDGKADIAVTGGDPDGLVSILLGNGDGTFQDAQYFNIGIWPNSVAVGDFNRDGIPDLVVAHNTDTVYCSVSVLLGNGDGTFGAAQSFRVGPEEIGDFNISVAVGDFNSDGYPDLAVTIWGTTDSPGTTVRVLLNAADWGR